MSTRWARSADKHQIERADALNAMRSATLFLVGYDEARVEGSPSVDLFIGPTRDDLHMLEVLVHMNIEKKEVLIFHVMYLRRATLERARKIVRERKERGND